jgi:hypothetical protein
MVSYQYIEWPTGVLSPFSLTSPEASYFYPFGGGGFGVSFSHVEVSPGPLPADGKTPAIVTVTLVDANGAPLAGKQVTVTAVLQLASGGAVMLSTVTQPAGVTDANGQATASLTSTRAGTVTISATDVTDGITLARQPQVQFTPALTAPGQDLASAITALANSSGDLLGSTIAGIATEEGRDGDYFQTQLAADKREQAVNELATGLGGVLAFVPGSKDMLVEALKALDIDIAFDDLSSILDALAGSSTGLTQVGQQIDKDNAGLSATEVASGQQLLAGVPPTAVGYLADYQNDVALRGQADEWLNSVLSSQRDLLRDLTQVSELGHVHLMDSFFSVFDVVAAAGGAILTESPAGAEAGQVAVSLAEGFAQYAVNQVNLDNDQRAYNSAVTFLLNCRYLSGLVDLNTKAALNQIAQGQRPNPVTGHIVTIDTVETYEPLGGILGDLTTWARETFGVTEYVHVDGAYSLLTITNSGSQAASFSVNSFYSHTFIAGEPGVSTASIALPMVASAAANIPSGQSAVVRVGYYDGSTGAAPDDGQPITVQVLGGDGSGGLFAVDQTTSTIHWEQAGVAEASAQPMPMGGPRPKGGGGPTNLFGIDTPIEEFVYQDLGDQVYQAKIWIANPFAIPLLATVTQPVPAGVAVVSTDGLLGPGAIVWTNALPTNGLAEESFSFTLSVPPGALTNLPPPTLVLTDWTGTNSLTQTAVVASSTGLFPVGISASIPSGTWGADTPAQVAITNFTYATQAGSLVVSLTNGAGSAVTNISLPFSLDGESGTNIAYALPGSLAPGAYLVTGVLTIGGGTGQVFSGTYVLDPAPAWLTPGPATDVPSDGFALELGGTPGYGYLIQCSTNLVDWQPAQYLVLTNSTGQFTDYYSPLYTQRFYRAIQVSAGP